MTGFDSDDGVETVAERLDVKPTDEAVVNRIDELDESVDEITGKLNLTDGSLPPDASTVEKLKHLSSAVDDGRVVGVGSQSSSTGRHSTDHDGGRGRGPSAAATGSERRSGKSEARRRSDEADSLEADGKLDSTSPPVDSGVQNDDSPASMAARRVRERTGSPGQVTQALLSSLEGNSADEIEDALERTVEVVESASVRNDVSIDQDEVRQRLDDAQSEVARLGDGELIEVVSDRLEELRNQLERAEDTNKLLSYAVKTEATFHRNTLVEALAEEWEPSAGPKTTDDHGLGDDERTDDGEMKATDQSEGAVGTDDLMATVEELRNRRETITHRYVNQRGDHNHTIPLLFLSVVDSLSEAAEDALATGDRGRADGIATATHELLDNVESLYERNEYSVMLRRLRGN
jgi:hypothetical protein